MTDDTHHYRFDDDQTERIWRIHQWWCAICDEHNVEHPPHPFLSTIYAAEWAVESCRLGQAKREYEQHLAHGGRTQ